MEVVQTVERPRKTEIQESPLAVESLDILNLNTPGRETPLFDPKAANLSRSTSWNATNTKSRKSIRSSLMG